MGITGNLRTMTAGDLLQWLSLAQKTGTLVVTNQAVEKKIVFRQGRVTSSASNDPREYLGQFLMSHGYITEDELKKAMEVQVQSKILLGKILVTINAISEEDLLRLMRLKAEEEIYDIFLWKEGEFKFLDDELPRMEMVPLQVDVTGIIMEGTRRVDEWSRIRELVPNSTMVPVLEKAVDQTKLTESQRMILQAINGHRSIDEIILESRSSNFAVSKLVHDLIEAALLRLIDRQVASPPQAPSPEKSAEAAAADPEDEVMGMVTRAQGTLRTGDYEKALRLLKAAQNLDPDNAKVKAALKGAETVIASELKAAGIHDDRIPKLARTLDELSTMNFSPNEGFILSRINGMWDIGSLVKISPMRETDALLIFFKLHRDKVIEFTK
jgi:hypothetical protein